MNCCDCIWKNKTPLKYEIVYDDGMTGIHPERGTEKSSGIDVFVPKGFEMYQLIPGEDILIPLNIRIEIPENFDVEVKNKSGISTKMKLIKGAQLIDEDYRGILKIHLFNIGHEPVVITEKMKIAQLVVRPVYRCAIVEVESIDINTERGDGGFGSTGITK
jgi:dUTP pyrophosphatase